VLLKKLLINGVSSTLTNQLKLEQLHHEFSINLSKIIKFGFKIEQQKNWAIALPKASIGLNLPVVFLGHS